VKVGAAEVIRWLLVPVLLGIAIVWHQRNPVAARRFSPSVVAGLGITWLVLASSTIPGVMVHRWAGHSFLILGWLGVPIVCGVAIAESLLARRWTPVFHAIVFVVAIGLSFLTAFTGYIERVTSGGALRFLVIHVLAGPTLVLSGLGLSWWASRRYEKSRITTGCS